MRRMLVGIFVVGLLLTDAGSSLASVVRLGKCEHDEGLTCEASGKVRHPRRLAMTLRSHPLEGDRQSSRPSLNVDWATVCWKWSGRGRRDGYRVTVRTPFEKYLPMAYWRPDKCRVHVYATASIEEMGGSKLVLRARV